MSVVDETCKGCMNLVNYRGYGPESGKHCNYIIDAGEHRGCPAGKGCIRYEKKHKDRKAKEVLNK